MFLFVSNSFLTNVDSLRLLNNIYKFLRIFGVILGKRAKNWWQIVTFRAFYKEFCVALIIGHLKWLHNDTKIKRPGINPGQYEMVANFN
jgi:hypothetical protein